MLSKLILVIAILFWIWVLFEAWRAPLFRENENGSFTALSEPKNLKDLWLKIKGIFKISNK